MLAAGPRCVLGLSEWQNIWIFLLANFAAASFAAGVFRYVHAGNNSGGFYFLLCTISDD